MIRLASALAALVLSLSAVACAAPAGEDTAEGNETSQEIVRGSIIVTSSQAPDGTFGFRVTAANGGLLATSKAFASADESTSAVGHLLNHGNEPAWFDVLATDAGGFVFEMKDPAGTAILTSDPYATSASADRGLVNFRAIVRVDQQQRLAAAAAATAPAK